MTGAYLRIQRNGKWENIQVEHLTNDERILIFTNQRPQYIVMWLNKVCETLNFADRTIENLREDLES